MTYQIQFEEPPENTPPELAAWLQRQIFAIQQGLEQRLNLDIPYEHTEVLEEGMIRMFLAGPDGTALSPGLYYYLNGDWYEVDSTIVP